jgi:hypothetical protein
MLKTIDAMKAYGVAFVAVTSKQRRRAPAKLKDRSQIRRPAALAAERRPLTGLHISCFFASTSS